MKSLVLLTLMAASAASAHDGHGAGSAHLHSTDAWALMAGLAGAGALMWWRSRK